MGLKPLRSSDVLQIYIRQFLPRCVLFTIRVRLSEQPQTLSANQIHSGQININTSEISSKVRNQDLSQESALSQVWVGNPQQAICIPANSMKVVQGRTNGITRWLSCMVEARACNNLPRGVVVNRTMFTPNKNK